MKRLPKIVICIVFVFAIAASYFAGSYMKEQTHIDTRMQRCSTLILFAIDKAENDDIANHDVMEALISNLYAAYQFCDDPDLAMQLHDLWNTLIFEEDHYIGREDVLAAQLRNVLETLQAKHP